MSKFQDGLIANGHCDERGAGFCATATRLPGGECGLVELRKVENLKIRASLFSQVLRFTYQGDEYAFTNFFGVKPALQVIEEESRK